jgi:hypothetical protein
MPKFPCFAGHLQYPPTPRNTPEVTYKEGAAGSNPASPTKKSSILQVKHRTRERAGVRFPAPFTAIVLQSFCFRASSRALVA